MANRVRVIYQSESVYSGPSPATGSHFSSGVSGVLTSGNLVNLLQRVQSCNYSFGATHKDVNQFGELAAIDRIIVDSPTATMDISYLLANFTNEAYLGFVTDGSSSCISGLLNKTRDERNYFLKIVGEGVDSVGDTTTGSPVAVVGIGNGFLSSYSTKGQVGDFPSVDIKVEGLNAAIYLGISGLVPSINPTSGTSITGYYFSLPTAVSSPGTGALAISTLRPGDITLSLYKHNANDTQSAYDYLGPLISNAKIQSYDFTMNLTREAILALGSRYAVSREIRFPIEVTSSISAVVGDLVTGNFGDFVAVDSNYDMVVTINSPQTTVGGGQVVVAQYTLKKAKVNNTSFSTNIGSNKTVKIDFTAQVGGPNQLTNGFFMSGIASTPAF